MDSLPMLPASCTLERPAQQAQLQRYRAAGAQAITAQRGPQRLVVRFAGSVADDEIEELIAVERECCPFFTLDWAADERALTVSVARPEETPALDAIAFALGVSVGESRPSRS